MPTHIKMCLIVFLILLVSCHTRARGINPKIFDAFHGFDLETHGPAKLEKDGSVDVTYIVPHQENNESVPGELQTGTQYVFHHRGSSANDEELGAKQLPDRLKELGFQVVEAPKYNGGEFSYGYIGGPFFHIIFTDGSHKVIIFNKSCDWVRDKNWIVEDYVLVVLS